MQAQRTDLDRARDFLRAAFPAIGATDANLDRMARPLALAFQAARHEQMEIDAAQVCPFCAADSPSVAALPVRDNLGGTWAHTSTMGFKPAFVCHASEIREAYTMRQSAEDIAK